MNTDLTTRTPSEELWLWRRRQVSPSGRQRGRIGSGMSQTEAAQVLSIPSQRYHDAETARLPERDIRAMLAELNNGEQPPPTPSELCALARRRSGMTLVYCYTVLKLSKVTFLERERAGDVGVVSHWKSVGFTFA